MVRTVGAAADRTRPGTRCAVLVPDGRDQVVVTVPPEAFRRWDGDGWVVDEGTWEVVVAASSTDVRQHLRLEVA